MPEDDTRQPTLLELMRTQMQYVVPLIRDLQAILGEEVVNEALAERNRRRFQEAKSAPAPEADLEQLAEGTGFFAAGDALDYEILESSPERFDMNVTRCGYAAMMEEFGAREVGHLLICNLDFEMAARMGTELTRTQTCMQGAARCDFRYRKRG